MDSLYRRTFLVNGVNAVFVQNNRFDIYSNEGILLGHVYVNNEGSMDAFTIHNGHGYFINNDGQLHSFPIRELKIESESAEKYVFSNPVFHDPVFHDLALEIKINDDGSFTIKGTESSKTYNRSGVLQEA